MRLKVSIIFLVIVINGCQCDAGTSYRQERAKVIYMNPKYVKDLTIFTFRPTRSSPYLTNCNATILHSWGNNLTIILDLKNKKFGSVDFQLELKQCDIFKHPWAQEWLKTYTNVPLSCPLPANSYYFKEMELPPKNFPVPVTNSDYHIRFMYVITTTKEKVIELSMDFTFQGKKGRK